ncbi:MAG TPA: chemotaxis protein CheD [Nitrospirota bacterium]
MSVACYSLPVVELKPGEIFVASEPNIIKTLLGSCVAVCLFSKDHQIAAMSHCVLPAPKFKNTQDVRYVEHAVASMLEDLNALGVPLYALEAKLFGGSDMFSKKFNNDNLKKMIGDANVKAARQILRGACIKITAEDVGGTRGRVLLLNSATGEAFVRLIRPSGITGELACG